jgi:hypothetical protein
MDVSHRSASVVDGTTHFQEILEMSVGILRCLTAERICLNQVHQSRLELKAIIALVTIHSSRDVAAGWDRVLTKSLSHGCC